ncbi:TetR/AcrR family transcriptional regulator [Streptomyces sp. NPDC001443]
MTTTRGRTGRPPLTEERKAEIRLQIARAAVALFATQGVAATTGEQIGQAVGISARTLWRYFPSKESCVSPLFSAGINAIAAALRQWRPGQPLQEVFERAVSTDDHFVAGPAHDLVGALVRLTRTEPGLRAVWLQSYDEAEPAFARALAEREGLPADDLRPAIHAAMFNAALRAAVEYYAWHTAREITDPQSAEAALAATIRAALTAAAEGVG